MNLSIEPEAENDLKQFDVEHRKFILEKLRELEEKPTGHENSDTIRIKGRQVFKYVMKQGSRGGKDYRAVYDIRDNKIKVIAIFHRDKGYRKEKLDGRV